MFGWYRKRNKKWNEVFVPALIVVAWCAYVVVVGGDFMEFRLVVPMMPFLFITLAYLIYHHMPGLVNHRVVAVLSALILCSASAYHGTTFKTLTEDKTLDSIPILPIFYGVYPDGNWSRIGLRMKEELAGTDAKISTSAVGSIPFYSELRTVNAIGLCDENVTNPEAFAPAAHFRPGHSQRVTLSYLKQQSVNFILDQPMPIRRGVITNPLVAQELAGWVLHAAHRDQPPDSIETVVGMPLDSRTSLLMLYLTRTTTLDSVMSARGWEVAHVRMR